ncbi:AbrB/MazE/SpoVT family DNA-binding domain-containing protein [Loktanella salsilacus]|uniref:AbrB/MazE/SpoVT family DNA-binding domain-containing protein n=1 Tax=Loktanella salsilacus TaxID=195913 RepID=UPI003735E6FE
MQESTLTSKGQTTLPRDVRQALSLQAGDRVRYLILDGGEVRIMRSRPAASLAGILRRDAAEPVTLQAMDDAIAAGACDKA